MTTLHAMQTTLYAMQTTVMKAGDLITAIFDSVDLFECIEDLEKPTRKARCGSLRSYDVAIVIENKYIFGNHWSKILFHGRIYLTHQNNIRLISSTI
jgi:hypothetical protein